MREHRITPIILAGGKGTRLWPLSRRERPKQFIPLVGELSLLQQTLLRVTDDDRYGPAIVVTSAEHEFLVLDQAKSCGCQAPSLILEPIARNTAPAITAAALLADMRGSQLLHIMPSDHQITKDSRYLRAIDLAIIAAEDDALVTFGITPSNPATGYGYIEAAVNGFEEAPSILRFIEKPREDLAADLLQRSDVYWNSGMFLFKSDRFLKECLELAPDVYHPVREAFGEPNMDAGRILLNEHSFMKAANISIDHAIFEKTKHSRVIPSDFHWSDLGSWDSVWKESGTDQAGNVAKGPVTLHKTNNSLILSDGIQVAVNGVDDLSIIASDDAIYIGKITDAQNIAQIVEALGQTPDTASLLARHRTTHRPWGGYTQLLLGERFQVKKLFVDPGKKLSLQKHHHRSEHWIVVKGTAEVTCDERVFSLSETEATYIPRGAIHRIFNPGKIVLELIEIQTGSYLGEDDIVRFEDDFGRASQTSERR